MAIKHVDFIIIPSTCHWISDLGGGEGVIQIQVCSIGKHGMQHGRCEAKWLNPKVGHQHASSDAGWRSHMGHWSGSNSSVRKLLLLLIDKGCIS